MSGRGVIQQGRIFVDGLRLHAFHGHFAHERKYGQMFEIELELVADLAEAAATDNLKATVDYGKVAAITRRAFCGAPRTLVEAAAFDVAEALLAAFARIECHYFINNGFLRQDDQLLADIDRIPYMAPGLVGPDKASRGKLPTDTWWLTIVPTNSAERTGYPTQKPLKLLERIVRASSNPGELVADFFCGSGTTGVAAKGLGRRYLLVDDNPDAVRITNERLSSSAPR